MSRKWRKIDDLKVFSGKGITPKYVDESSIIVLNQKCIRNNKIDYSFSQFTNDTVNINENKFIQEGDVLFNSTGQGTAGRVAFVDTLPKDKQVIVDSHILIVRFENYYEAQCLCYSFYSYERKIQAFMDGSTGQGELDKTRVFNLLTSLTENPTEQKKIAKVLSDLDAKIELNNKINQELEAMTKTLYDYWFVQFDFPNEQGKPYKSSGGKMVYNKELKREIPDGWEVKELSKITSVSNESIDPMLSPDKDFKHYSIPTFDSTKTYGIEKGIDIRSNKFVVAESDVLVSKLNPWFTRVIYPLNEENLICSTEFVVCRTSNLNIKNYIFNLVRNKHFITYCMQSATGTSNSHKRVNPTVMMSYKTSFNSDLVEKFGSVVEPWIKMSKNKLQEIQQLTELRDWLLPMLMNGQVTVS